MLGVGAIDVAVCSTGLIGERLPMRRGTVRSGHGGRRPRDRPPRPAAAATAVMTTDTAPQAGRRDAPGRLVGRRLRQGRRHARAEPGHHASRDHHRRRRSTGRRSTPRCAPRPRVTFDRLDVDGGTSTNDTVLLLASGASGVAPTDAEFAGPAHRRLPPTWSSSSRPTPRASTKEIAIDGARRGHRGRRGARRSRGRPRTTWSRPRSSAPTRTGAGSHGAGTLRRGRRPGPARRHDQRRRAAAPAACRPRTAPGPT